MTTETEGAQPETAAPETAEISAAEAAAAPAAIEAPEEGVEGAAEAPEGAETPTEAPKKKSPVAQLQGRVGHLTKTLHERDGALAEKDRQIEAYKALLEGRGGTADPDDPAPARPLPSQISQPAPGTPEFDQLVLTEAQKVAARDAFNRDCNAIFEDGSKKHGEAFKEAVANLNALGFMDPGLVQAAMATGAAADVINALGEDVDEAQRIAALPPVQKGVELAKLAAKISAPAAGPQISRMPAPITPVGGTAQASNDVYDPGLSDEEYYRRRAASGAKYHKAQK
jgi:hypothetical protein